MSFYNRTPDEFTCLDVEGEYTPAELQTEGHTFDVIKFRVYAKDKWGRFKENWAMLVYGGEDEWDSQEAARRAIILHMLWHRQSDGKTFGPPTPDRVYQVIQMRTIGVPVAVVEPVLKERVAPPEGYQDGTDPE